MNETARHVIMLRDHTKEHFLCGMENGNFRRRCDFTVTNLVAANCDACALRLAVLVANFGKYDGYSSKKIQAMLRLLKVKA